MNPRSTRKTDEGVNLRANRESFISPRAKLSDRITATTPTAKTVPPMLTGDLLYHTRKGTRSQEAKSLHTFERNSKIRSELDEDIGSNFGPFSEEITISKATDSC